MFEYVHLDTPREKSFEVEELGQALVWLAVGGLLGLAVAVPYDRMLGLPSETGTVLASAVWIALLGLPQWRCPAPDRGRTSRR